MGRTAGRRDPAPAGDRARGPEQRRRQADPSSETAGPREVTLTPWRRPAATRWVRPGLEVAHGGLRIAGRDAEALARQHGTPLFIYDRTRFGENARRLEGALAATGLPFRLRFALKANPLPEILDVFRGLGEPGAPDIVGIDACSPGEVERAIDLRWRADEISFAGTNVSERDFDVLLARDAGCYHQAMSSTHCLRPMAGAVFLDR